MVLSQSSGLSDVIWDIPDIAGVQVGGIWGQI